MVPVPGDHTWYRYRKAQDGKSTIDLPTLQHENKKYTNIYALLTFYINVPFD